MTSELLTSTPLLAAGLLGLVGVLGGALALGIRHGVDWDHIAAITDITSSTASSEPTWLQHEPGVMLTDESHHSLARMASVTPAVVGVGAGGGGRAVTYGERVEPAIFAEVRRAVQPHGPAIWLGTLYALGHGTMVAALGLLAILASEFLPSWIDPEMERVVGVTLIVLAVYLFYSLLRFFRDGESFHLRSRWMLVFSAANALFHRIGDRLSREPHHHEHVAADAQQYGARTAYGVGLIHGIGAETGTQVLIIATAVGAGNKATGIAALMAFVVGLLISNSVVTLMTTLGFVSTKSKQWIYVGVGVLAAVFSLVVGLLFVFEAGGTLPDLGEYFKWVGGQD